MAPQHSRNTLPAGLSQERADGIEKRQVGLARTILFGAAPASLDDVLAPRVTQEPAGQRRFADSGLARDEDHSTKSGNGLSQKSLQAPQLWLTADKCARSVV